MVQCCLFYPLIFVLCVGKENCKYVVSKDKIWSGFCYFFCFFYAVLDYLINVEA